MSESPTEYVRKLENEARCLRADRERLTAERDRAQLRALEAQESAQAMMQTAQNSALTAERALARVQELEDFVARAIQWRKCGEGEHDERPCGRCTRNFLAHVRAELQKREARS